MPIKQVLDPKLSKQLYHDNWRIRRRWLRIGMLVLSLNAQWVLIYTLFYDSSVGVQIFMTLLGAIMSTFMIYVFGAVWDDNNKRGNLNRWMPRDEDEAPPPEDETADPINKKKDIE